MKSKYVLKWHHSEEKVPESILEPEISYSEGKRTLEQCAEDWVGMGLKVKEKRLRVEAKGATYSMAVYMEKL